MLTVHSSLPVPPADSGPLSVRESKELLRLEAVIEAGLRTFLDVGQALVSIRDARLYRDHHGCFETYCRERWGMSKTHANRLIGAASTVRLLGDIPTLPANESQVRPLTLLPAEQQAEAWKKALEAAGTLRKVTASKVQEIVDDMLASNRGQLLQRQQPFPSVRFVDRDRLVQDLVSFCSRHKIRLPSKILSFLRKY